jgi:hypothetical protein
MTAKANLATLKAMWSRMTSFTPSTPDSKINTLTQFFEPNCIVYLSGMTAPPCNGHEELVAGTKKLVQMWAMHELIVTATVVSEDGLRIVQAMENHLKILGQDVKGFHEAEVVTFSEGGKIQEYLLYCDSGPIKAAVAKVSAGKS